MNFIKRNIGTLVTLILVAVYCFHSSSCASTKAAPSGGPKDTLPPEIVADIIAHVRRAVLHTPIRNHEEKVKMAFKKLIEENSFNKMQLDLLEKIKTYMLHESLLNVETFEAPAFKMEGGYARFDKKFAGRLAEIIRQINTYIYEGVA